MLRKGENTMYGGFGTGGCNNLCSPIIALLILFWSGVLRNDRAWILILLFLLCRGCNHGVGHGYGYGVSPYGVRCSC